MRVLITVLACWGAPASVPAVPPPGATGEFAVLTCKPRVPPPFESVRITYGPRETVDGADHIWWQLEAREKVDSAVPLFQIRGLTSRDPLGAAEGPIGFARYLLCVPGANEVIEYVNVHTGRAWLPRWRDFERHFVPSRARGAGRQGALPTTAEYLGHVLMLREVGRSEWTPWADAKVLKLDPELLVGTGRNFKDREGRRMPQIPEGSEYTFIPFTGDDYRVMIEAGANLFTVAPDQERFVRAEAVFYLRSAGGKPPLVYPTDLYRSNYLGPVMFMDEPSIIMVGDKLIHNTLRYFSDAAAVITKRVRSEYGGSGHYGAFALEKALIDRGVNLGDMRIEQWDYPTWETLYETAWYQLAAPVAGIVHEGRYQLAPFDEAVARFAETPRKHTAEELLRYHYAFLRGAARAFGKQWGTAIYGQCDPAIAPQAVTLAYDMGARYVWFWTSDHGHHVPWPEQLELTRTLRRHAAAHPRASIFGDPPVLDLAVVIPYGYFLSLENLWWVRCMDPEGRNEASQAYRRLMKRAFEAIHRAMDERLEFDVLVDDGRPIRGYRQVVRITDRP